MFHIFYLLGAACQMSQWRLEVEISDLLTKELTFKRCCVLGVVTLRILTFECTEDTSWLAKKAVHSSICQTVETEQSVWLA